jgi:hypothetical protein
LAAYRQRFSCAFIQVVLLGQPGFHISRFVMAVVDSEAERENIKVLFSTLETTSTQIMLITYASLYHFFLA